MKYLVFFSCLLFLPAFSSADENTEPVKVYCFSADLEAGFTDEIAEEMCRAISKRGKKKKSLMLTDVADAQIVVEFIGITGESVVEEAGQKFVPYAGSVWEAEKKERTLAATLTVGDYTKQFIRSSTGEAVASGLGSEIEEWIRENREVILQKAREK
ncbi:MAG: hypothetical protein ACYS8Z_21840 [Planctomycetota bacterium]